MGRRVGALEALEHGLDVKPLKGDPVDLLKERVAVDATSGLEELVDLFRGDGALELLAAVSGRTQRGQQWSLAGGREMRGRPERTQAAPPRAPQTTCPS